MKQFSTHDTDSLVLADIRELLFVLVDKYGEYSPRLERFIAERMDDVDTD